MAASELWERLKHDLAFRVGTVYAGASWFAVEALDTLGMEPVAVRRAALWLLAGFLVLIPAVWLWDRRRRLDTSAGVPVRWPLRGTRAWALSLGLLCAVTLGLWAFSSAVNARPVPAAATRLAVLPFQASGAAEVREYGVGMVNLLSAALADVGGIRTVPSQTVLARAADRPPATLEDHLALGEALGAGSVLTGSITAFGTNVRLTGSIRALPAGEELATAEVEGALADVLRLTDRLAVELLRALWRSRSPLPTVSASALTTTSPAALGAYLRGESFLRALATDSAVFYFERATQLDSTFAMAWLRLASASGWSQGENYVRRLGWVERARSLADRLPEREAALARAYAVRLGGSLAALDSLVAYTARYPDDPMGHYELGDIRFHTAMLGRFRTEEVVAPFLESVRLDPTLATGLHHVLDLTLDEGDSAAFHDALERYARVGPAARVASFRAQARVRWAAPDAVLRVFAAELAPLGASQNRYEINQLIGALGNRVRLDLKVDPMAYVHAMDTIRARFGSDRYFELRARNLRYLHFGSLGMADSVGAELDRWLALDPPGPPLPKAITRAVMRVDNAIEGTLPLSAVANDVRILEQHLDTVPEFVLGLALYHAAAGDHERVRRMQVPPLDGPIDIPGVTDTAALKAGFTGWMRILQGDTVNGLRDFETSLAAIGAHPMVSPPGRQYGEILARQPERRAQAIRILHWYTVHHAVNTARTFLHLGRALEAEGDRAGAREAYQHVVRLWAHADPFRHADRQEAVRALERLAAEPRD